MLGLLDSFTEGVGLCTDGSVVPSESAIEHCDENVILGTLESMLTCECFNDEFILYLEYEDILNVFSRLISVHLCSKYHHYLMIAYHLLTAIACFVAFDVM